MPGHNIGQAVWALVVILECLVAWAAPPAHHVVLRQGRRAHMEDRVAVWHGSLSGAEYYRSDASIYAVYDGHASSAVSESLSHQLHQAVVQELVAQTDGARRGLLGINYTMALQAAFEHMDQQLIELLQANGTLVGSQSSGATDSAGSSSFRRSAADDPGSTAVLAMLLHQQRMLVVGNVGNSRALLCSSKEDASKGERGQLRPVTLSRPHELWQPDEKERVLQAGGTVTGGKGGRVARLEGDLELSRAFGDLRYRHKGLIAIPEVHGPRPLDKGDEFLVLASDGLFEVMNPTEVCAHAHAAAAGKGHPALSAPRPPAIPLHSTPPSAAQQARQLLLLAAQPLTRAASTVAQALSSLFDIALLQGGFLPWQSPAEPPGLSACCDCCGRKACDRQAAIGARRARTITARAHHQRTAAASCEAPCTPAKVAPMAEAVAWRLIQEAFNRGSMDNLAVVVVDLTTLSSDPDGWGGIPLALAASESQQRLWVPDGSWPLAVAHRPVLLSNCAHTDAGHNAAEGCAWTLHSTSSALAKVAPGAKGANPAQDFFESLATAPNGSAYVLTERLAVMPSRSEWHAHAYGSGNWSSDQQWAVTWPLELSVLSRAWEGPLALHLLLPDVEQEAAERTTEVVVGPDATPASMEAHPQPDTSGQHAQAAPTAGAVAQVDILREWNGLLDLLASVCLIHDVVPQQQQQQQQQQEGTAEGSAVVLINATDGAGSCASSLAPQPAASSQAPGVSSHGVPDAQPPHSKTPPSPLSAPGSTARRGAAPPLPGPLMSAAAPPPLVSEHFDAGGGHSRRGRALMMSEDEEEDAEHHQSEGAHSHGAASSQRPHVPAAGGSSPHSAGLGEPSASDRTDGARLKASGPNPGPGQDKEADAGTGQEAMLPGPVVSTGYGGRQHALFLGDSSVYRLNQRRGQGHFGEVWQAVQYGTNIPSPCRTPGEPCEHTQGGAWVPRGQFVLKRLLTEKGAGVKLSGLREVYFGELLRRHQASADAGVREPSTAGAVHLEGFQHLVRFVESFSASNTDHNTSDTHQGDDAEGTDQGTDLWIVLHDEGKSLHDLMYEAVSLAGPSSDEGGSESAGAEGQQQSTSDGASPGFEIMGASRWWRGMRRSPQGPDAIRQLMRQLMLALDALHALNITHRDVKPENMLLKGRPSWQRPGCGPLDQSQTAGGTAGPTSSKANKGWRPADISDMSSKSSGAGAGSGAGASSSSRQNPGSTGSRAAGQPDCESPGDGYHVRLIDLGSAIDHYSLQNLYGSEGPSAAELTLEYAPPEALFGRYWEGSHGLKANAWAHDIWAAGIVWLELLLATPHVFQLPAHTRAMIDVKLRMSERSEGDQQLLYLLRGMMEWCIYPPQVPSKLRGRKELVSWSCTEQAMMQLIKSRDPTGVGIDSLTAVSLLRRLLHWEPGMRPTAHQALNHAYFTRTAPVDSAHCAPFGEEGWC